MAMHRDAPRLVDHPTILPKRVLPEPIRSANRFALTFARLQEGFMDGIIYLVGLVVVIMAILSFLGLR